MSLPAPHTTTCTTDTQEPAVPDLQPQQLIAALQANGWTISTEFAHHTVLDWPGDAGYLHKISVPTDPTMRVYAAAFGGALAYLARTVDTGRRAAAVLASLGACDQAGNKITAPDTPTLTSEDIAEALFPLLVQVADRDSLDINDDDIRNGHHRIEGYAWIAQEAWKLGAASRDQVKSSTDEEATAPGSAPGAALGPTRRAQMAERSARDIAVDLLGAMTANAPFAALLDEAARRLLVLASDVASAETARDGALKRADTAEGLLTLANTQMTKLLEQLADLEGRHAKLGEARDGHADRADTAERELARLRRRPVAAIAPGVDPLSGTWLPAEDVHAGWAPAGGNDPCRLAGHHPVCGEPMPDVATITCTYPVGHAPITKDIRGCGERDMEHGSETRAVWWNGRTATVMGDVLEETPPLPQLCSDKAGFHGPHDYRADPDDNQLTYCLGIPDPRN